MSKRLNFRSYEFKIDRLIHEESETFIICTKRKAEYE